MTLDPIGLKLTPFLTPKHVNQYLIPYGGKIWWGKILANDHMNLPNLNQPNFMLQIDLAILSMLYVCIKVL